jgi:HlyD family secretion protein
MAKQRSRTYYFGFGVMTATAVAAALFYQVTNGEPIEPSTVGLALVEPPLGRVIVAPGTVEPESEVIEVGAALAGRLAEVKVEEGDWVTRGQVLAVVENDQLAAQVAMVEAEVRAREAELEQLLNGARPQERREAAAAVDERAAQVGLARTNRDRFAKLANAGYTSSEELDRAEQEYAAARARLRAERERVALIEAPPRLEAVAQSKANLALTKARLDQARATYDKSFVRAPISGRVLRKFRKAGEVIPELVDRPIVSLGNTATLRVRAEVDERDIGRLENGLSAYVTAPAYGAQKFHGHIVRIGEQLGRKGIYSDEPTERVDTKVLETLIELDPGAPLVTGLRVDTYIQTSANPTASAESAPATTSAPVERGRGA